MLWHFFERSPRSTTRNPIQGEFFADDAIANPAEALVREAVQNSLDAASNGQPVRVRIYVSGSEGALPPERIKEWLTGSWEHIEATGNGLRSAPRRSDPCLFAVIEDFNTSGLRGDVRQYAHDPGVSNPFFAFFRAEGVCDKTDGDRGRWGIGKFVFPRSSRISSFFGLTVRVGESQPLLLGRMILKSHRTAATSWEPDGYFGLDAGEASPILPSDDPATIALFRETFQIRRSAEPGLSVVVPYAEDDITAEAVLASLVKDYYYALARGDLEAVVESPSSGQVNVSAATLDAVLARLGDALREELAPLLELARWSLQCPEADLIRLNPPGGSNAPKWTEHVIDDIMLTQIKESLSRGGAGVRVPVRIRPKRGGEMEGHFDVFIRRTDDSGLRRPAFIREGILVSEAGKRNLRRVRAMVTIGPGPLAKFLGDAENPAHTKWVREGTNFKGTYTYGPATLDYVTESVTAILNRIEAADAQLDRSLLADVFSVPIPEEPAQPGPDRPERKPRRGEQPPPVPTLPARRPRYRLERIEGGFRLAAAANCAPPERMIVRLGYGVRAGNAIQLWQPMDFDVRDPQIVVTASDVTVEKRAGNELQLASLGPSFDVSVAGFDPYRDLTVQVSVPEVE